MKGTRRKQRDKVTRKRNKIILIGIEGKNKTEKNYFLSLIKDVGGNYKIRFSSGNYTDPNNILQTMIYYIKEHELNKKEGDLFYCVFDTDTDPNKQSIIDKTCQKASEHKIEVILSNPCFEVWFLQHFEYSTKQFINNNEVIEKLKKHLSTYEKSSDVYDKLKNKTAKAIKNSKQLEKYHNEQGRPNKHISRNPSSEVYKIAEKFII